MHAHNAVAHVLIPLSVHSHPVQVRSLTTEHGVVVDLQEVLAARSIRTFDTALMLPLYGFKVRGAGVPKACLAKGLPDTGGGA